MKQLGADRVVDYRTTPLTKLDQRFSVIVDVASTSSFGECEPLLERGGTYVVLLPSGRLVLGMARALLSSKRCKLLIVSSKASDLEQLATWFDDGRLASVVDRTYPLAELPAALVRQRTGEVRGKLAITI